MINKYFSLYIVSYKRNTLLYITIIIYTLLYNKNKYCYYTSSLLIYKKKEVFISSRIYTSSRISTCRVHHMHYVDLIKNRISNY